MSITITVRDESLTGTVVGEMPLEFPTETLTIRELIRERIYQEVQDFNRTASETFRGLVQPSDTEQFTNARGMSFKLKKNRQIDWKVQYDKALEAFTNNGFLIIVDQTQAESLDETITIRATSEVSFLKLTPLVGG